MQAKILAINTVSLANTSQGRVVIASTGTVTTSGWGNAQLQPRIYLRPPVDGLWDWDFVADAPKGFVLQVISPIAAQTESLSAPDWFKGVRIHASTNAMEQGVHELLSNKLTGAEVVFGSNGVDPIPWPWVVA
jgi:hypothetical protein